MIVPSDYSASGSSRYAQLRAQEPRQVNNSTSRKRPLTDQRQARTQLRQSASVHVPASMNARYVTQKEP